MDPAKIAMFRTYDKPKGQGGSGSFATFMIIARFFIKLFKPSEANLLFDGASMVLYVVGVVVYITNIVKGLRIVTIGVYSIPEGNTELAVGREDTLRVMAASNTILALILVGVLVLQAGQWYAERSAQHESESFEKEQVEKAATKKTGGHVTRSASKKKQ
ncbi:Secretory component protein [Lachnellula subtilissima]|uniref:Secretory component protein n=1 Tax=Lachnellula subtilissima TaxID=602034 RepID=A0A8H8S0U5_9HELO|nr:Secretory component protein [Lachnellula subtilissima]